MSALDEVLAARLELHKSIYWPAARRAQGSNHLWLSDTHMVKAIDALTAPPPIPPTHKTWGLPLLVGSN